MILGCAEDGATGPAGADGNANVIGTNTVTVSSWTSSDNNRFWSATLLAEGITQSIVNNGTLSVFMSDNNGGWFAMPYSIGVSSWTYGFGVGFVNIYYTNTSYTATPNPGPRTFRVVIISSSNRMAHPNVNWNNYDEVKTALNLKD